MFPTARTNLNATKQFAECHDIPLGSIRVSLNGTPDAKENLIPTRPNLF